MRVLQNDKNHHHFTTPSIFYSMIRLLNSASDSCACNHLNLLNDSKGSILSVQIRTYGTQPQGIITMSDI